MNHTSSSFDFNAAASEKNSSKLLSSSSGEYRKKHLSQGVGSYEVHVQRRLNREKVIEFENEIRQKLYYLKEIEGKMSKINEKRGEWLKNISFQHYTDNTNFHNKVELIKAQTELISNQVSPFALLLSV
jgi:hypothetical protein